MEIHVFDRDPAAQSFPAGHVVFNAGEIGDKMYAVVAGEVEILVRGKVIETIRAGGIFGEMALIEDLPRSASAVVKSDARLVPVDRNRFLYMVQNTPFFSLQVLAVVAERLRRTLGPAEQKA